MTSVLRIRPLAALLAVPLALWSSLPTVRWCTTDWSLVSVECFLPCAAGLADANGQCEAGSDDDASDRCAGPTCEAMPPGDGPGAGDGGAEFPCGIAFCVDGPTGGDGLPASGRPPVPEPAPVAAAILPAAPAAPAAPARWLGAPVRSESPPATSTRAGFHQARAPPASA